MISISTPRRLFGLLCIAVGVFGCECDETISEIPGTLQATLCGVDSGLPLEGIAIRVVDSFGNEFTDVSGENGKITLEGLSSGDAEVFIDEEERRRSATIASGETTELNDTACQEFEFPPDTGGVTGRVCSPDGASWLSGATVAVDGTTVQTTTDDDGRFVLIDVPVGERTLRIQQGSFVTTREVTVIDGEITSISDASCAITVDSLQIAVVTGLYDNVQSVLATLGVPEENITIFQGEIAFDDFGGVGTTPWAAELLHDAEALATYDLIFINCGADMQAFRGSYFGELFGPPPDEIAIQNLRDWVEAGGSVYVSDESYDVVEVAWPNFIDFYDDDTLSGAADQGAPVSSMVGNVTDPDLAASLGSPTIELRYPLGAWAVMQTVSSDVTVYVRADAPIESGTLLQDVPHTVGFSVGAGRVIYTSFHISDNSSEGQERLLQLLMFEL